MTSTKTQQIIDQPNFYFNPPPPGEPGPTAPYNGITQRERVFQNATTTSECWYTTMRWLSPSPGLASSRDFDREQNAEQLVSHRRNMLRRAVNTLGDIDKLNSALKEAYYVAEVTKTAAAHFPRPLQLQGFDQATCEKTLKEFQDQTSAATLSLFAVKTFIKMSNDVDANFLYGALCNDPIKDFNQERVSSFVVEYYAESAIRQLERPWDSISLMEKRWAVASMAIMTCARLFNLKQSSWNPHKPVTHLINEMRDKGPLMVQGYFGQSYYKSKPFELAAQVGQRTIFGWRSDAEKEKDMDNQFHPILLVGARSDTEGGHVYFVDALDASDPKLNSRRVYVMSYSKLQKDAATISGIKADIEVFPTQATNFAWCAEWFKGYI